MEIQNRKLKAEKILQLGIYFYAMLCFVVLKAVPYVNDDVFVCISIMALTYFIGKDFFKAVKVFLEASSEHRIRNCIFLLICSLVISFSIGANNWFYHEYWGCWGPTLWGGICFLFMTVYAMLLCITVNFWVVDRPGGTFNITENGKYFAYLIFAIFFSSGIIYLIAYNPAHMHADTYAQLRQIFGIDPLHDWHPVYHTLFIKVFLEICSSPSLFAMFHIALFAYVMTLWITKLAKKGINKKLLLLISISFYFNIAYGFLITDIWKDNIYNILVIWITYLWYCMTDDFSEFNQKVSNYCLLVVCAVGICFVRHNGIVPALFIFAACLLEGAIKKKKKLFAAGVMVGLLCFVVKPISYQMMQVLPNENGIKFIPFVHDIASVIVCNQGENLPGEVIAEMESIIPLEQWTESFVSTDSDSYTFHVAEFLPNLSSKSTEQVLSVYAKAFLNEPVRIAAARLMSSQQMWSMFKRSGQGDYLGEKTNDPQIENDFGYIRSENLLTSWANHMYDVFENSKFLNTIFFRTGIWMDLMITAIFIVLINPKSKKLFFILIPLAGYMVSLTIAMTCQNLRYVWAVFIIAIMFFLLVRAEYYKGRSDVCK